MVCRHPVGGSTKGPSKCSATSVPVLLSCGWGDGLVCGDTYEVYVHMWRGTRCLATYGELARCTDGEQGFLPSRFKETSWKPYFVSFVHFAMVSYILRLRRISLRIVFRIGATLATGTCIAYLLQGSSPISDLMKPDNATSSPLNHC